MFNDDEYMKLLERAYVLLPETATTSIRFIPPRIKSQIQGKNTVILNISEVSKLINRDADLLVKYLLKELATSGIFDGTHLILKGNFRQEQIQKKFENFLYDYVICPSCGKPDTRLIKEGRILMLKCDACGSRNPIGMAKITRKIVTGEIKEGDVLKVYISRINEYGDGIAEYGNYIVIIPGAKDGEVVKVKVKKIENNKIHAEIIERQKI